MGNIKKKNIEIKETAKTFKGVFYYIRGYWKDTILTWILALIESICEILVAYFLQFVIDAIKNSNYTNIYIYCGVIAALAICAAGVGIAAGYWASSAACGFAKNLREAMYVKIQDFSFSNIDKYSTSSIVTRTTTDVTNVQNAFQQAIRAVVRAPFMMILSLIMCFVTEWKLAWIFCVIIPVVLFFLLFIATKVHPLFVKVFDTYDSLNASVEENVDGIRVVKAFNREEQEKQKFGKISAFIYKNFTHAEKVLAGNGPLLNGAIYFAMLAVAYFGGTLIINSGGTDLSTGGYTTLLTYVMMIFNSLMMISMVYVMLTIARNSAERINELLHEVPSITSPENSLKTVQNGDVSFNNVSFAYVKDKNVLNNISFSVKSGETVGIIGSTGSSKTTLVSLMARLYDVNEGEVKVGDNDVRQYDLESLRDAVAVVLQKNTLFTGTIKDNLCWGNENATSEDIKRACDLAQCTSFIESFPDGLNTKLDEGGTNVSGGQKQRLCIARALLKNPKILILDDSTSACDTHTDSLIREALMKERKDITKFIIAQRVLSIKDCDTIFVMDAGKIVASGNNDALYKTCPVYKSLFDSQLGGGGDFDARN
jgi:ATP-binding cassette subfamily B protein